MKTTLWRIVRTLVTLLGAIATFWVFWEFWFSEPIVAHGDLDTADPFSLPFEISNPHYFPLTLVETNCIVNTSYSTYAESNKQLQEAHPTVRTLWHSDSIPYLCHSWLSANEYKEVNIRVILRYRALSILPQRVWHRDFRIMKDSQGMPHWVAADPDSRMSKFIEYSKPSDGALFYCDFEFSAAGTTQACGARAPYNATVHDLTVRRDGNMIHVTLKVDRRKTEK